MRLKAASSHQNDKISIHVFTPTTLHVDICASRYHRQNNSTENRQHKTQERIWRCFVRCIIQVNWFLMRIWLLIACNWVVERMWIIIVCALVSLFNNEHFVITQFSLFLPRRPHGTTSNRYRNFLLAQLFSSPQWSRQEGVDGKISNFNLPSQARDFFSTLTRKKTISSASERAVEKMKI